LNSNVETQLRQGLEFILSCRLKLK